MKNWIPGEPIRVDLYREDLIYLAKGCPPNYAAMDKVGKHGRLDAIRGEWAWNYDAFNGLSNNEIFNIYLICKNSWKE